MTHLLIVWRACAVTGGTNATVWIVALVNVNGMGEN